MVKVIGEKVRISDVASSAENSPEEDESLAQAILNDAAEHGVIEKGAEKGFFRVAFKKRSFLLRPVKKS